MGRTRQQARHHRRQRRERLLGIAAIAATVAALTLGGIGAAGAEDTAGTDPTTDTTAAPETTSSTSAPAETAPPTTAPTEATPPTTAPAETPASAGAASTSSADTSSPAALDAPVQGQALVECKPDLIGNNSWESDPRADPNGECTDGNPSQGGHQLALCQARFGNQVTTFYDSVDSTGTGNGDVTGAITPHPGGGTQLNVTPAPGVVILGVFVKAGDAFNAYNGNEPNMIGPLTGVAGNFANISHYIVCYGFSELTGGLNVLKSVVGPVPGLTTFTVAVDCNDGTSHDGTIGFDSTGAIITSGPGVGTITSLPITGIPVSTSCTVTETGTGGADAVVITGSPAVITVVPTAQVTVTNTFFEPGFGGLTVTKSVQGLPPSNSTTFTVNVDCNDQGGTHDGTIVFDVGGNLITSGPNAGTITSLPITGIPETTSCTVTEPLNGGATTVQITGSPAVIVAGQVSGVTVTNTFTEVGGNVTVSLNVDKAVIGSIKPPNGTPFVVHVVCSGGATVDEFLTFTYPNGLGSQPIVKQIPSGSSLSCTVTETDPGGIILAGYQIDGGGLQGSANVTLDVNKTQASVTVVNDPSRAIQVGGASASTLPFTGSTTEGLLKAAAWLLALGGGLYLVAWRRRRHAA